MLMDGYWFCLIVLSVMFWWLMTVC